MTGGRQLADDVMCLYPRFDTRYPFITVGPALVSCSGIVILLFRQNYPWKAATTASLNFFSRPRLASSSSTIALYFL